jgi:hypothetical protein
MNAATIISETIPFLHAAAAADLCGWSEADLYGFLNKATTESCTRVAFQVAEWLSASHSTSAVTLPTQSTRVIDVAFGGSCLEVESPAALHARIDRWEDRFDPWPESFVVEQQGAKGARLFPAPTTARQLLVVHSEVPATLVNGSNVSAVVALDVLCGLRTIAEANTRQGEFAFPESAGFASALAQIVENAAFAYYGGAV